MREPVFRVAEYAGLKPACFMLYVYLNNVMKPYVLWNLQAFEIAILRNQKLMIGLCSFFKQILPQFSLSLDFYKSESAVQLNFSKLQYCSLALFTRSIGSMMRL